MAADVVRRVAARLSAVRPRSAAEAVRDLAPLLAERPLAMPILWSALRALGAADLSTGRIFEAHVNATALVRQHGAAPLVDRVARLGQAGAAVALWVADDPAAPVTLDTRRMVLHGAKQCCSGGAAVAAAVVTARTEEGSRLVWLDAPDPARFSAGATWPLSGMTATESLRCDLTGLEVGSRAMIGEADAYRREPAFSGGLWRILALQLGALDGLAMACAAYLRARGHDGAPAQRARLMANLLDVETAALWSWRAARAADADAEAVVQVALARSAIRDAADLVAVRVRHAIGLAAMVEGSDILRRLRDLDTLLCQPAPDAAQAAAADRLATLGWALPEARA